jgi:long-chain acyl-CoA synthetase
MSIRILDDDGNDLPARREGTVYFEPATGRRFRYQGDEAKTDLAHHGDAFTVGDIGWVDDDGFLYLCGRQADVVISAGVNVYPAEIEQALTDVAGIADLCAVGGPDPDRGEVIVLHISLLPDADHDGTLTAIDERSAAALAPYKRPREVRVVDEIPRDQTGKLLRRVLRDPLWLGHEHFAATTPASSQPRDDLDPEAVDLTE